MNLNPLRQMLEGWQRDLKAWEQTYKKTSGPIERILEDGNYQFSDCDILSIWEFLNNDYRLNEFLNSDTFTEHLDLYEPWLKNLFRLACKAATRLESGFSKQEEQWNDLLSNCSGLMVLCENKAFKNLKAQIRNILYSNIDWGD